MKAVSERTAVLSPCGGYRYRLGRRWTAAPVVTWVMLNPSTADADVDDATIRRCMAYARTWHAGGIEVVNLYAWRATDPAQLRTAADPVGPDNDAYLTEAALAAGREKRLLVAGWGNHADPGRVERVLSLPGMSHLMALAVTGRGAPSHPLYLRAGLVPVPYRG